MVEAFLNSQGYRILGEYGRGVQGIVMRCSDKNNQQVAVKIIPKEGKWRRKCPEEILALQRAQGLRNVNQMICHFSSPTHWFIVLEACSEMKLVDFVKKSNNRVETVQKILRCVITAVADLHRANIGHRDIKMENVLLGQNDVPVLSDLGQAFLADPVSQRFSTKGDVGTIGMQAPEILRSLVYDSRHLDMYSVGCLAYMLLYDSLPYIGTTQQIVHQQYLHIPSFPSNPVVADSGKDFIRWCLHPLPSYRLTPTEALQNNFVKQDSHVSSEKPGDNAA